MKSNGYLVLESGEIFPGSWHGGDERYGEVVFNTAHSGYEETATDPSYLHQILVCTATQMGNYGSDRSAWESRQICINGFVCLQMQDSSRDSRWCDQLIAAQVPVLSDVDTRKLVLRLRENGTLQGALVQGSSESQAKLRAADLKKRFEQIDRDWVYECSRRNFEDRQGALVSGPRIAVIDYGVKENSLRELTRRCSALRIFPSRTAASEILDWSPDGVLLSNGPGDPTDVQVAVQTVRDLLNTTVVFGICMGHQILALALGAQTYKLKFGHRGVNHPVEDKILNRVYMTSQNHGYAVDIATLPKSVQVSHVNLNDLTVSGIFYPEKKCLGVQFHPESHPGPNDSIELFDFFLRGLQ